MKKKLRVVKISKKLSNPVLLIDTTEYRSDLATLKISEILLNNPTLEGDFFACFYGQNK